MALKISQWRPKLIQWLNSQITINAWDLNPPDIDTTTGFVPPLRELSYTLNSPTEIAAVATQDIFILKSYDGMLRYQDLPIATLEGVYQTLGIRLVHDYKDISEDVDDLTFVGLPEPIIVKSVGDEANDWVIELHWVVELAFLALPEVGVIQPPFLLKGIDTGIYRSKLDDFEDNKLDLKFSVRYEEPEGVVLIYSNTVVTLTGQGTISEPNTSFNGLGTLSLSSSVTVVDSTVSIGSLSELDLTSTATIGDATVALSSTGVISLSSVSTVTEAITSITGAGSLALTGAGAVISDVGNLASTADLDLQSTGDITDATVSLSSTQGLAVGSTGTISDRTVQLAGTGNLGLSGVSTVTDITQAISGTSGLAVSGSGTIVEQSSEAPVSISGSHSLAISGSGVILEDTRLYTAEFNDSQFTPLSTAAAYNPNAYTWTSNASANGAGQMVPNNTGHSLLSVANRNVRITTRVMVPTGSINLRLRAVDAFNSWGAHVNATGIVNITRRVSSANTTVASGDLNSLGINITNTYIDVEFSVSGDTITFKVNGTTLVTYTDTTVSSVNPTGDKVGWNTVDLTVLIDSYKVYRV